jgi:hypothetical protein
MPLCCTRDRRSRYPAHSSELINTTYSSELSQTTHSSELTSTTRSSELISTSRSSELISTTHSSELISTTRSSELINTTRNSELISTTHSQEFTYVPFIIINRSVKRRGRFLIFLGAFSDLQKCDYCLRYPPPTNSTPTGRIFMKLDI